MRVAIVGCGGIAKVHAESISSLHKHQIIAFVDIKKERALKFAMQYGGNAYETLEEMLDKERIDVLHICTPHYLHVPMAIMALEQGIHVYQEKPAAISAQQYQELWNAVKKAKAHLGVSYQNRYNDCVRTAKKMIESGEVGKVLGGRAFVTWNRNQDYYIKSGWRGKLSTEGGGCLINQAVHTLDLLTELIGKPVGVEAEITNHHLKDDIEVEDTVEAYITFRTETEECHGNFYATTSYCVDSIPLVEIVCENVTLRIEDPVLTLIYSDGRVETPSLRKEEEGFGKKYWGNGHKKAISDFYEAVEQNRECLLDLKNTDMSNRLMLAMYEAAKSGKTVRIIEETKG